MRCDDTNYASVPISTRRICGAAITFASQDAGRHDHVNGAVRACSPMHPSRHEQAATDDWARARPARIPAGPRRVVEFFQSRGQNEPSSIPGRAHSYRYTPADELLSARPEPVRCRSVMARLRVQSLDAGARRRLAYLISIAAAACEGGRRMYWMVHPRCPEAPVN